MVVVVVVEEEEEEEEGRREEEEEEEEEAEEFSRCALSASARASASCTVSSASGFCSRETLCGRDQSGAGVRVRV